MPPYRPSFILLTAWVGLFSLVGAATGLMIAWYGGLLWVLASLPPAQQTPGSLPSDVLIRLEHWLWPSLVPLVLVGAVAGAALAAHRAAACDRSPQRWRNRAWQLGGVWLGALVGLPGAVSLVGAWSLLTLGLGSDGPPPSVFSQSRDIVILDLLIVIPLASALFGRWLGAALEGRANRRNHPT